MSSHFDQFDDYVILASDDLAIEETASSRKRYKFSNSLYGSPKISTPPLKIHNLNRFSNSDIVRKSIYQWGNNNNNYRSRLEEKFPEISKIFKYEKNSREELMKWLERNRDNNKNVIYINSESITAEKLYDLCDKHIWLSSDHINAYLSYLNLKFRHVFSLTSFFYTKLTEVGRYKYSSVEQWTKRIEIFQKDIIFIPINMNESHWILATIFMKGQFRIVVMDSLGTLSNDSAITIGENLIRWLNDEYRHKFRVFKEDGSSEINQNIRQPKLIDAVDSNGQVSFTLDIMFRKGKAPQVDGSSCGVFVCMFSRLMAENVDKDVIVEIAKMPEASIKFRKVICTELWEYAKENKQVKFDERYRGFEDYFFSP